MQRTVPDLDHTVLRYKSTCPAVLSGIALLQEGAAEMIKALKASSEGQSLTLTDPDWLWVLGAVTLPRLDDRIADTGVLLSDQSP